MNVDAIAEVKVLTGSFQAEYGRASGMQIAAVTKSGTNRFRGGIYTSAATRTGTRTPGSTSRTESRTSNVVKEADSGYTLGGPIGKPGGNNKLFFFFAQEWRPRETSGSIARFRVPTPAERARRLLGLARQQRQHLQPDSRRQHEPARARRRTPPAASRTAASSARFPPAG